MLNVTDYRRVALLGHRCELFRAVRGPIALVAFRLQRQVRQVVQVGVLAACSVERWPLGLPQQERFLAVQV